MNLGIVLFFLILTVLPVNAMPRPSTNDPLLGVHGFIKNETAHQIGSQDEFTKIKNTLFISKEGKFSPNVGYKATGRIYYDAVFDLNKKYYSKGVEKSQETEAELRDTYLDLSHGNFDLRIGKQQIVWGEAVGLFFADVVNPQDLREFILPEFDQMRIPLWSADLEYYKCGNHFEFVWVPILKFHELGVSGSEFELAKPTVPTGALTYYQNEDKPSNDLKNGEFGIRLSRSLKGWDLAAFCLYGYDYFPTYFRTLSADPLTSTTIITFKPRYERLTLLGATFAKEIEDVIFKGEIICNNNKYFLVNDLTDIDGVVKKDFLDYLIGIDYTFFKKVDFNFQFMQRIIFNHDANMADNEMATSFSIWLKTGFFDNTLEPELFFVSSLRKSDSMFRPKVSYKFKGKWTAVLGIDVFDGRPDGNFGQFDAKDRAYLELKYDF
jgi:hypothetical protein